MTRTLAEQWRERKPKDWESIEAYLADIQSFDPDVYFEQTDLGAVITFSDKSQHRMGA